MTKTRHFVVTTDPITSDQASAFRTWLSENGIGWWHWIDSVWLLDSDEADIDAASIRNQLNQLVPNLTCLVSEVKPLDWSGYGPKTEKQNMFQWLHESWPDE